MIKKIQDLENQDEENFGMMEEIKPEFIIREGGLKKKSSKKWQERYFVLDSRCIYYGKNKKSLTRAFSRIDLESVSVRSCEDSLYGKYCFELVTPHKVYVLKGNNSENKQKWMQSISKQCAIIAENKAFENLNEKIRRAELQRANRDEKVLISMKKFENLIEVREGVKLLVNYVKDNKVKDLVFSIVEYTANAEQHPSEGLIHAESKA